MKMRFPDYQSDHQTGLFTRYTKIFSKDIPEDFLIHHLVGSFAETVKWRVARNMVPEPDAVANFYMNAVTK